VTRRARAAHGEPAGGPGTLPRTPPHCTTRWRPRRRPGTINPIVDILTPHLSLGVAAGIGACATTEGEFCDGGAHPDTARLVFDERMGSHARLTIKPRTDTRDIALGFDVLVIRGEGYRVMWPDPPAPGPTGSPSYAAAG